METSEPTETPLDQTTSGQNQDDEGDSPNDAEELDRENVVEQEEQQLIQRVGTDKPVSVWPVPITEVFTDIHQWPNLEPASEAPESANGSICGLPWVLHHQEILLRVITWNLCAAPPPSEDMTMQTLIPKNRFHVVIIGSEECERSIMASALNPSKKVWEAYLISVMGPSYAPLRSHTLQAMHIMAFAHTSIAHLCSDITSVAVATGIGNTMGNKGGVTISLNVGNTRIVVTNAHLAAHQNAVKQRNADFMKISASTAQQLSKKTYSGLKPTSVSVAESNDSVPASTDVPVGEGGAGPVVDVASGSSRQDADAAGGRAVRVRDVNSLSGCGDRVIFMGDLNYRIRGERSMVDKLLVLNMHDVLTHHDQLR
jgi:hypothetical protein